MNFKDSELGIIFRLTVSSDSAIKALPFLSAKCFIFSADGNRMEHPDPAHSSVNCPCCWGGCDSTEFLCVWVTQERNALGVSGMIYQTSYHSWSNSPGQIEQCCCQWGWCKGQVNTFWEGQLYWASSTVHRVGHLRSWKQTEMLI